MPLLLDLDTTLFYFVNHHMVNPMFDWLMPVMSGNAALFPILIVLALVIMKQGGLRGAAFVLMAVIAALIASNWVCAPLKEMIMRPRPALVLENVRLLIGNGKGMMAMPSGHATNWGVLAMVAFLFHPVSWRFMLPLALTVACSRVYLGVHYPSDVTAGLLLGAGVAAVTVWICTQLWKYLGRHLLPAWWAECPSLLRRKPAMHLDHPDEARSQTWRNATLILLALLFIGRLAYIASDTIELGEDEAYQWMWSKHLDWAYYSKPPMIAWIQWMGTHLWGDSAFGVRFFSPFLALVFGVMIWLFLRHRTDERTVFWTTLVFAATPLFGVGSTLLTVDAPTVFFYTASLLTVWLAMEKDSTAWWLLAGLCMALGFLSKFFSPFLWVGLLMFLVWAPEFRKQLKRPGLWLALLINMLGVVPVLIWNASHHWVTATHLQERGGLDHAAQYSLATLGEFSGSVIALLNPVFFIAILVALWGFVWMKKKPALWRFLFCSCVPVFVFYLILACRAKAQPNWIGPASPTLFLLGILWWHQRSLQGNRAPARWLAAGLAIGLPLVTFLHETRLIPKALGIQISERKDPLNRVRGGSDLARIVGEQRASMLKEGRPVFLISDHYGRASLLNFYLPEARQVLPEGQLSYVLSSDKPQNQYWFWPGYENRAGENAIYVVEGAGGRKAPKRLREEFERVESLGAFKVKHDGKVCSQVQLFACWGKKPVSIDIAPIKLTEATAK